MMNTYKVSDLQKVPTGEVPPPPSDETLQISVKSAKDGIATGIWHVDHQFINGIGVAMGGFLSAAADTMMAYAISSKLNDQKSFITIDLHTTFHRPIVVGEVEVTAAVERLGKSVSYVTAELIQNGKLAASCTSSQFIQDQ